MNYREIRRYVDDLGLKYRKLQRLVIQDEFFQACETASDLELGELGGWIERAEVSKIRKWLKDKIEQDLHDLTVPKLRLIARRYMLKGWNTLDKTNLIEIIELEQRRRLIGTDQ